MGTDAKSPAELLALQKGSRPDNKPLPRAQRREHWTCLIREKRESLGLTQYEVAAAVQLAAGALCELERGCDPCLTTARRIAEFFAVSIETLWPSLKSAEQRSTK